MGTQFEQAIVDLFPQGDSGSVFNVKFFRGHLSQVTAEQLAEQLRSASAQINEGTAVRFDNIDGEVAA